MRLDQFESFGNYRIIGPIARGGMAELSLAVQVGVQGFTRVVALKRVLPSNAASAPFVQMFLDEARLAARLDHPQIVRIYELGAHQNSYFMSMEYLPGEDLTHLGQLALAAGQPVDPDLAAYVVERAAEALHFAHELTDPDGRPLGLVHRDVTPSNILVTYNGHVKVVDFGIAKAATNTFETEVGMIKGKMGYLAPEQFTDGMTIDRTCDIFGLGIVLWELLSGENLFRRESQAATLMAVREGVVPSLRDLRPEIDPQLEAIVFKALQRDPAQRFQTANEMQEALEHYTRHRSFRPSDRDLARWVEGLGGEKRATLKRNIARGTNVSESFSELRRIGMAQTQGVVRPPSTASAGKPRALWQVGVFALGGAALIGATVFAAERPIPFPASPAQLTASAQVDSEPPGAFVFVNGEPTGKVTPATLGGFQPGPLDLRIEKAGYAAARATLTLEAGKQIAQRFPLVADMGIVQFANIVEGGLVRVGGKSARRGEQLELPVGQAVLQVLVDGRVVLTRDVVILAGPQTIDLKP